MESKDSETKDNNNIEKKQSIEARHGAKRSKRRLYFAVQGLYVPCKPLHPWHPVAASRT